MKLNHRWSQVEPQRSSNEVRIIPVQLFFACLIFSKFTFAECIAILTFRPWYTNEIELLYRRQIGLLWDTIRALWFRWVVYQNFVHFCQRFAIFQTWADHRFNMKSRNINEIRENPLLDASNINNLFWSNGGNNSCNKQLECIDQMSWIFNNKLDG